MQIFSKAENTVLATASPEQTSVSDPRTDRSRKGCFTNGSEIFFAVGILPSHSQSE